LSELNQKIWGRKEDVSKKKKNLLRREKTEEKEDFVGAFR